ncbi:MAG: ABC transporter permease, partial [Corynebacterium casei]|nr:ABC transporter permease [Corynebacterium casei]
MTSTQISSQQARWKRLPIIKDVIRSAGLQRAMLIAGLILTIGFIITAIFAPLIAPYSWAQTSGEFGSFGTQQPPSDTNIWGTTVSGFDVFSRVIWGTRTAVAVIIAAVAASMILGVLLGLISGYIGGWLDRV